MILKNLNKNLLINILLIFFIFLFDRISKIYFINLDKKLPNPEIFSSKFLNITLIWNEGIAFGLLSFDQSNLYNSITLIIIIVIFIIGLMAVKSHGLKKYSLIMILGGAIGNLYDRIFYKAVPDFIDFHVNDFHWFIFNLADVFISLGVFFMILLEIIDNSKKQK
tara:strand:+ start:246 stop:740 length:495 start_codon:yes stop_codon:yes gene_type:complete